ncbi:phage holin family protein [Microvirga sp. SRT01]|uniref:Phage holin family protein n=1 Tax=Sphingomonas longa TaxID=2778730 RepID=A0ABS2D367_9SPHN|nr:MULTISPECIES: phage holin family protein [Alphaproteobacteria]MBM6575357.1 phage holin family protein [Sphingomonas sp. BT552]MBR7708406.1 phage holin family protein [Microvirga sp. SRT01]
MFGEQPGVTTLVGRLVDESRTLVSAEVALYKAKAGERVSAYKSAIVFFAIAGVLGLAALVALLVGLIMALATVLHPIWATLIVVGVVLLLAAVLGIVGKGRLAGPERSV